jgi:leader peptidase (prepilin peptidase)/N-methyltransferase
MFDRVPDDHRVLRPLAPIRLRGPYLGIHLVTLGVFLAAGQRFGDNLAQLALYLVFFCILVALAAIDLDTFRLPDKLVVPLLAASLPLIVAVTFLDTSWAISLGIPTGEPIRFALLGGVFYFAFLLVAHLISPRGMGFGDVKLAAVMGLYIGWLGHSVSSTLTLVLYAMFIGFITGSLGGLILLMIRRRSKPIPFGPFLVFGATVVIIFSEQLAPAAGLLR